MKLDDQNTWPKFGSIWKHSNGNRYRVMDYANIETDNQDRYPTTIIYQNIMNFNLYTRPLIDWHRSMTLVNN